MARPSDPNAKIDLLRAAEAVFVEHGLDRAKVEDITARAGRSKGSFYLHFATKEEAFRQIVETMLARLAACVDDTRLDEMDPMAEPEAYFAVWREKDLQVFEYLWQNRGVARLLFEGGKSADFGYLIDEFAERARARIREGLARERRRGLYRQDLDVELASLVMAGAYDRVARELVHLRDKPDLRRWLGEIQRTILGGIGSPAVLAGMARISDQRVSKGAGASAGAAPRRARKAGRGGERKSATKPEKKRRR